MPPKKDTIPNDGISMRKETQRIGISYEWKPFGQGGGIEVSTLDSQEREVSPPTEVVDGQTAETAPHTEQETQADVT